MTVLSLFFISASILFALAILLFGIKNLRGMDWTRGNDLLASFFTIALSFALVQFFFTSWPYFFVLATPPACAAIFFLQRRYVAYTTMGILFFFADVLLCAAAVPWIAVYAATLQISLMTRLLLAGLLPMLFLLLPFGYLRMLEQFDVLARKHWLRPRERSHTVLSREPLVSLHVPVHAEPPEIVIGTLTKLAALDYGNFEVLVIDNNTQEEALWRPVEAYCRTLGSRFRFFHVSPLSGAKAGALNFALSHTSKDAEIVGVIDSDYHTDPRFIRDLIGHFEDPKIGFVQTPHDYRDWQHNSYLTMCYWEYKAFFHTTLVALNERDAALTIGTMCLLRKSAVQEAGGWATWCLTEDSELAIRIHDLGYSSIYIPSTYGRGLIPATFGGYAQQRHRWIAGPVQELKYHARHLLRLTRTPSQLTRIQRIHHIHHGVGSALFGLTFPFLALSILLAVSMIAHHEIIAVPFPLWFSITVLFAANIFLSWLQYRVVLKTTAREMIFALIANKALSFSMNAAALGALIRGTQQWRRTDKFSRKQTVWNSLITTRRELCTGAALCAFAAVGYSLEPFPGLLSMCLLGIVYKSMDYLAAPVVALIAMRS